MPGAGCRMRCCASAEDLAERYFNATSPIVDWEQMDWEQIESASWEDDAEGVGEMSVAPSPHSEVFRGLRELWENKWHGKLDEMSSPPPYQAPKPVMKRTRQPVSAKKQIRRKESGSGYTYGEDNSPGGMSVPKNWRRLFSNKTSEFKLTKNGPCELFADWPIPRYPSDYDWEND